MSEAHPQGNQNIITEPPRRRRWLGLPVIQPVGDTLAQVLSHLPQFGRQPFTMTSVNGNEVGVNPYFDMIYRVPARTGEGRVPVGVVSKNYRLVDHHHVLRAIDEGWNAEPKGDLRNKRPSDVATDKTIEVPGIDPPVANAFEASQALTGGRRAKDGVGGRSGMAKPGSPTDGLATRAISSKRFAIRLI